MPPATVPVGRSQARQCGTQRRDSSLAADCHEPATALAPDPPLPPRLSGHPAAMAAMSNRPADLDVASARAAGLRYTDDQRPGIRRRRSGRGFAYARPDGSHGPRRGHPVSPPEAGDPARLDRCLDLPRPGRAPPGDRSGRPRSQAVPLSPSLADDARRGEVRATRGLRTGAAPDPTTDGRRPQAARPATREGPGIGRTAARADAHPGRQRRVREAESVVRPDDDAGPSREGRRSPGRLPFPRQERTTARGVDRRPPIGAARRPLPGPARPGALPVRRSGRLDPRCHLR